MPRSLKFFTMLALIFQAGFCKESIAAIRHAVAPPVVPLVERRRAVAPPVIPLPESNPWGASNYGNFWPTLNDPAIYHDLHKKGVGWIRYTVFWDKTVPRRPLGKDGFNWAVIDQEILNIRHAGLNVYLNIMWAPAWATQDQPAYETWACMTQSPPYIFRGDLPNGLQLFPWCGEYKPDLTEWMVWVKEVVRRYSQPPYNVKIYSLWNEPNYNIFWHYHDYEFPKVIDEGWPRSENLSIVREILVPGYRAVKEANPEALVASPEVDGDLFLKWLLQEEAVQGPITDIITIHDYGDNAFDGAHYDVRAVFDKLGPPDQSAGYGRVIRDFGRGRPVWLTETNQGYKDEDQKYFWDEIKKRPWIDKTYIFRDDSKWLAPPAD